MSCAYCAPKSTTKTVAGRAATLLIECAGSARFEWPAELPDSRTSPAVKCGLHTLVSHECNYMSRAHPARRTAPSLVKVRAGLTACRATRIPPGSKSAARRYPPYASSYPCNELSTASNSTRRPQVVPPDSAIRRRRGARVSPVIPSGDGRGVDPRTAESRRRGHRPRRTRRTADGHTRRQTGRPIATAGARLCDAFRTAS